MTNASRRPIVGGNWKMNTTLPDAEALGLELRSAIDADAAVEVVIFPPFTNLTAVGRSIKGSKLHLGGQDLFWEPRGAYTGEISAEMLLSVGASWVICGHSERRHVLGETDEIVNRKSRRALESGLKVILAVGETEQERAGSQTAIVIERQLEGSLRDVPSDTLQSLVLAYEPVWAIGTGLTATPALAQEVHQLIRSWLADRYGGDPAQSIRIQYGGSVTADNAASLMAMPDIDGALVGGASLKPRDFAQIVRAAGG